VKLTFVILLALSELASADVPQIKGDCYQHIAEYNDEYGKDRNDQVLCIDSGTAYLRMYFSNTSQLSTVCYQSGKASELKSGEVELKMKQGLCENGRSYNSYSAKCKKGNAHLICKDKEGTIKYKFILNTLKHDAD